MSTSSIISLIGAGHSEGRLHALIAELWRYRELLYFFTWRDIKVRYKQAVLGVLWAVIQPLFTMIVFTVLFGRLANLPSDGLPQPVFYFSGLVPWLYFSGAVTAVSMSLVTSAELLTKIYFPRMLLPAASAAGGIIDLAIGSLILFGLMAVYGVPLGLKLLVWIALIPPLFLLAVSVGMILAALNVRFRDFRYIVPFGIQLWLFATPIIYPASLVPERYQMLLWFNPLAGLIEGLRYSVNPVSVMPWTLLAASLAWTALIFVVAVSFFRRSERNFADYV